MSHEIDMTNGAAMAYLGSDETPWHGLGNAMPAGASIDEWRRAAGMDFVVQRAMVRYATSSATNTDPSTYRVMNDRFVLVRSDNKNALGIVSDQYKIVQPREVMEFFRDLCEKMGFELATAGVLFDGRKFWALARVGREASIRDKRDRVGMFLLLSTSADGSSATEWRWTMVRVVCNNTLSLAVSDSKAHVRVSHKSTIDTDSVKQQLGLDIDNAKNSFDSAMDTFRRLAGTPVAPEKLVAATGELFAPGFADKDSKEQARIMRQSSFNRVGQLTFGKAKGSDFDGTGATAWGWLNAVTEYVDHESRVRVADKSLVTSNRLNSAWFGKGDSMKTRAMKIAVMMADGSTEYRDAPVDSPAPDFASLLGGPIDTGAGSDDFAALLASK